MHTPTTCVFIVILCAVLPAAGLSGADVRSPAGPIYNGPELDYQPAILRMAPSGDLMVVFERIEQSSFFGDLYVTFSSDNGATWSTPQPAIDTALNERHPALVQLGGGGFALFYLVDESGSGAYRIHRAVSADGKSWTSKGGLDLGWPTPGEINPCVICEKDGSITMTYHRLSGPSYIARSLDDGATWDKLQTTVSYQKAQLPRLAKRESDGMYLVTYQVGSSDMDIYAKVSKDPYDWSMNPAHLSTSVNSHDSQPIVLEGGVFLVAYAQQVASVFDIHYRTCHNGINWSEAVRVTTDPAHYDTQPHPLRHGTPGHVLLAWSHQESASPYQDHDVWLDQDLEIALPLKMDTDRLSASAGGQVVFSLDAGLGSGGSTYLLLGSLSGTMPGTYMPGGWHLPLNPDPLTMLILTYFNTPLFHNFLGTLDWTGRATATLNAPGPLPLSVGTALNFAFTTVLPYDFQSHPVDVVIVQ